VTTPESLIAQFETPYALELRFCDVPIRVLTNDEEIWARLQLYYAPYVMAGDWTPVTSVRLIRGEVDPGGHFLDIERGEEKKVKEAVQDVPGGRFILKRTTGVIMALWPGHAFAAGDLRSNLNQGINLINACYAKAVLRRGHLLLHASAVSWNGCTVALAGPPGVGKSTAALHLVEEGFRFLSNDRVLAKVTADGVEVLGYPKQPRVNPGTLLHHPRLALLLKPEEREALTAMREAELWKLEQKVDVDLDAIYGRGTVELRGRMQALVLLKWRLGGPRFSVRRVETAEALTNISVIHKDLGPFDLDRSPARAGQAAEQLSRYGDLLARLTVVEVTGQVDFSALVDAVGGLLSC
jgi:HprK-related kinase B